MLLSLILTLIHALNLLFIEHKMTLTRRKSFWILSEPTAIEISFQEICYFLLLLVMSAKYFFLTFGLTEFLRK